MSFCAAKRESVGNRMVPMVTAKIPCGSWYRRNEYPISAAARSLTNCAKYVSMSALKLRMPSVMVMGTMSASTRRSCGSPKWKLRLRGSPAARMASPSRISSTMVPTSVPQASAYTPQSLCQTSMKAMMTRFHTMLTTAGIVKRSCAYSTPVSTPASASTSTVGTRIWR